MFGVIWVMIAGTVFFLNIKYLACLMMISTVFQSCSMLNIDNHCLSPMVFTCCLFILRYIIEMSGGCKIRLGKGIRYLLYFFIYLMLVTLIAPLCFGGVQVVSHASSNGSAVVTAGLRLSNVEWISLLSIAIYVIAGVCLYQIRKLLSYIDIVNICKFVLIFEFFISYVVQHLYFTKYLQNFADFFYGHKSSSWSLHQRFYMVGTFARYQGTFTEPSLAAPFFVALFWFFAFSTEKLKWLYCSIALICIIFNLSTTGFLTFAISIIIVIIILKKYKIFACLIPSGIIIAYFMYKIGIFGFAYRQIFAKFNDSNISFLTRVQWDITALKGFLASTGVGIGYCTTGSNSFCTALLLQGGIIGSILLVCFFKSMLMNLSNKNQLVRESIVVFILVILIGMSVAVGSLVYCSFWMAVYFIIVMQGESNVKKNN